MGLYNIVNPGSLVGGVPEDVSQVLANLQAIQTILNGGIDDVNVRNTAAIQATKLNHPGDTLKLLRGDGTWAVRPPTWQIFTSGSGNYNRPANVIAILVRGTGGGGGGGGAGPGGNGNGANAAGGGGGGGADVWKLIVSPAAQYAYVVGGGGANGDATPTAGQAGGDTTFGALLTAKGGSGGPGGSASYGSPNYTWGGAGGAAGSCVGDLIIAGGRGGTGVSMGQGNGVAIGMMALGGFGGSSGLGGTGGIGGGGTTGGTNAGDGESPGSGGGGAGQIGAGWGNGGDGAGGRLIVLEFYA